MFIFIRKYSAVLKINWIQALEYRANALVGIIAIISGLFIEYQIWSLIFKSQDLTHVNGFSFYELMVFIFLSIIVGQLKSSWHTSGEMIEGIRTGDINKFLIRPISYFWYHFMMFLGINSLYIIVYISLLILFVFIFPGMIFQSFMSVVGFFITLLLSIYMSYCIYFIMVCFAFWFGEVRSIVVAYNVGMLMISGQYIPIRLFPKEILAFLEWTPIPYLVDLPVSIATGLIDQNQWGSEILPGLLWAFILTILSFMIYRFGIKGYEAYGQ